MLTRKPLGVDDFHQHINLDKAQSILDNKHVVVIAGPSGAGKSELALQLQKRFKETSDDLIVGVFRSDDLDLTLPDVERFAKLKNLPLTALRHEDPEDVFRKLYKSLNKKYPNECKLLIFDDVEPPTDIIHYVDQTFLTRISNEDLQRNKWKFIFTTQSSHDIWVRYCDHVTHANFLRVDGFSDEEMKQFFNHSRNAQLLSQEQVDEIAKKLGRLPLILQVLLKEMVDGESATSALRKLVDGDINFGVEHGGVEALHRSLSRLIQQSDRSDEHKQLIMLLTMFNATDFTLELLTSCAEVTLVDDRRGLRNFYQSAQNLRRDLITNMNNRCLCDPPETFEDTTLVSFHKLIMQSMRLFRTSERSPEQDIEMSMKALLALTRVMPRDGRDSQSHVIYGYMYSHASALVKEINNLIQTEVKGAEKTPCIMLWMSNLQMSMGYCMHAQRLSDTKATEHIKEALDWFSRLATGRKYNELGAENPDIPPHVQRARTLFDEITGPRSVLIADECFKTLVAQVTRFLRLTKRDVEVLFDTTSDVTPNFLSNGHLDERQINELLYKKKALKPDELEKFYAAELLAEIYATAAKAIRFHRNPDLKPECMEYAKAARELYALIKLEFKVTLMAEVVTEREMLHIQLKSENITEPELEEILDYWKELLKMDAKGFEYGLMRADFSNDPYNTFLCKEGLAITEGRICAISNDVNRFAQVRAKFEDLIAATEAEDPKYQMNLQATSKVYRNYGEFLWRCRKFGEAVKVILEALVCLNIFLCRHRRDAEQLSTFPELDESFGKAKGLIELLNKCFDDYETSPSAEGLLQRDGSDQRRINYAVRLVGFWRERGRKPDDFSVMEKILEASNIDLDDIYGDVDGPEEASVMIEDA